MAEALKRKMPSRPNGAPRNGEKSAEAFRTISEVATDLDLPQHVLRFWESKFPQVRPMKRGGGRRHYRPEDVLLLRRIRDLLYTDRYTIRGVQKLLRENDAKVVAERPDAPPPTEAPVLGESELAELRALLRDLQDMQRILNRS